MKPSDIEQTIDYKELRQTLLSSKNQTELYDKIVNAPFKYQVGMTFMFLGIIAFLLVDKKTKTINRLAYSKTDLSEDVSKVSSLPFNEIKISLDDSDNLIAKAINSNQIQSTTDWKDLLMPALSQEQAQINQAAGGIAFTAVYPFKSLAGGAITFNYFQYEEEIGELQTDFMRRYTEIVDDVLKNFK